MKKVSLKKMFYFLAAMGAALVMTNTGCKKNQESIADSPKNNSALSNVSLDDVIKDLKTIKMLGFDPLSAQIVADGYIVEGDIRLTRKHLDAGLTTQSPRQEQYATQYKIATSGIRTINIALSGSSIARNLNTAFNNTVTELNNLKLPSLKFVKVTDASKADITIAYKDLGGDNGTGKVVGAKDGSFVNPDGNPGSDISINSNSAAGIATRSVAVLQSTLLHEFGHAIGLRHTDYKNKLYSRLKSKGIDPTEATLNDELTSIVKKVIDDKYGYGTWDKASTADQDRLKAQYLASFVEADDVASAPFSLATHIYGTPLTPTYTNNTYNLDTDANSIMLSNTDSNITTFSSYDIIALFGLYGNANQLALINSYLTSTGTITPAANANGITTIAQVVTAVKAL